MTKTYNKLVRDRIPEIIASDGKTCTVEVLSDSRYADFALESNGRRVAIEIDDEASHHKGLVASGKFYDDLLKQNSMVYLGWDVYRWAVRQMQLQPELVKDELRVFLGNRPRLREIEDYLPPQRGRALDGGSLELKKHSGRRWRLCGPCGSAGKPSPCSATPRAQAKQ